jgi:A/G-specific adenine glycosylase
VEQFSGRVPNDAVALQQFPGVGRYIAGAICSFAFGAAEPILEANCARVLSRLFAWSEPVQSPGSNRKLWSLSEALLCRRDPAAYNQALMELGALVCVPGRPRCELCPVRELCRARRLGIEAELPRVAPPRKPVLVQDAAAIVHRNGKILIVKRPEQGRWGGLWELPRTTIERRSDPREALCTHVRATLGLRLEIGNTVLTVRHDVTHHRITLVCYDSRPVAGRLRLNGYDAYRWITPARLRDYPCSSPQRTVFATLARRARP